jgi:hypothetical protein
MTTRHADVCRICRTASPSLVSWAPYLWTAWLCISPVFVYEDDREGEINCIGDVKAETRDIYPRTSAQTNGGIISLNQVQ